MPPSKLFGLWRSLPDASCDPQRSIFLMLVVVFLMTWMIFLRKAREELHANVRLKIKMKKTGEEHSRINILHRTTSMMFNRQWRKNPTPPI